MIDALSAVGTRANLARWLGPWTPDHRAPRGIRCDALTIPGGPEAWLYRPRGRVRGRLLVVPGLHYAGPADPRLDRFLRVLAASGLLVCAPFLRDFAALRLRPRMLADAEAALDAFLALPATGDARIGVFSVSFGSLAALHLAGAARQRARVGGVALFGGYADAPDAMRFALGARSGDDPGDDTIVRDPLNRAAVFINLLPWLDVDDAARDALHRSWLGFCQRTWGRVGLKRGNARRQVARDVADVAGLRGDLRALFLLGAGVGAGDEALAVAEGALARGADDLAWLDPAPLAARVRASTYVFHGADDDVIPASHAHRLAAMLPGEARAGVHVTGLYGHTGAAGLAQLGAAATELRTMAAMLAAIERVARP